MFSLYLSDTSQINHSAPTELSDQSVIVFL